jgi:hypothetical protein
MLLHRLVALVLLALLPLPDAGAWEDDGHRIVADVAEALLTPPARQRVDRLLNGARMRDVANYADDIRPFQLRTARWHFVNVAPGEPRYSPERDCRPVQGQGDCVIAAIDRALAALGNPGVPDGTQAAELTYLIHFVADVHQPFHAVTEARGGNDIRVSFFGTPTNLHRVWDLDIIKRTGINAEDYALNLVAKWNRERDRDGTAAEGGAVDWAMQSREIGQSALVANGADIDQSYIDRFLPVMNERLMLAGVRLAGILNRHFR